MSNLPKPTTEQKRQLQAKEARLQDMRLGSNLKREVTVDLTCQGFFKTGIMCDMVQVRY